MRWPAEGERPRCWMSMMSCCYCGNLTQVEVGGSTRLGQPARRGIARSSAQDSGTLSGRSADKQRAPSLGLRGLAGAEAGE